MQPWPVFFSRLQFRPKRMFIVNLFFNVAAASSINLRPRPRVPVIEQATALLRSEYAANATVRAAAALVIERLGLGLADLINVLNPDRILLGGLHRDLLAVDPGRLRATVADRSPWGRGSSVPVLGCALDNGSLVGAAELAWQPVLDDPSMLDR